MLRRTLLSLVSGLCLWLAFPSHNLWPLAFVGVAGLASATVGVSLRAGLLLGLVAGAAYFVPTLHWSGVYVGVLPWMALSLFEALYIGLLGVALALVQRRAVRPFAGACLWVAQEWLRGTQPFGGFPWARLAFSQADSPLARLASVAGAPGLTFAVALIGGLLGVIAVKAIGARPVAQPRRADRIPAGSVLVRRRRGLAAGSVLGIVVLLLAASVWPVPTAGKPFTVIGIQGNVPTAGLEFNAQRRAVLDNHVRLTEQVAAQIHRGQLQRPDLVVWPENSSDIDPLRNADAATEIQAAVRDIDAPTIIGAVLGEPAPKVSNASMLYLPGHDGPSARYVKQHPAPFAEYIPYRSFFRHFSSQVDLVTRDFAAGTKVGLFSIPTSRGAVRVGPIICFEVAYDSLTRAPVDEGAQLLIVQTNNATFGYTDESVQQLAISRIRAIEHGRSVVHVSTVGVSGLITPDGVVHDRSSLFTRKALAGTLPLRSERTLADRWGRAPEVLVSVIGGLLLLQGWRRRRDDRVHAAVVPTVAADPDSRTEKDMYDER